MRSAMALLAPLLVVVACSQQPAATSIEPVVFAHIYGLEVSATGFQAMLIEHEPLRANTKDSVWSKNHGWSECTPLQRRGRMWCGGFDVRATDDGIIATYELCRSTTVPVTRTVTDLTTGVAREETVRENRTHCSPVPVTVTALGSRNSPSREMEKSYFQQ